MTIDRELLRLAAILADTPGGTPGFMHVGRNRAISTAYSAVFHRLARLCAVELAGLQPSRSAYQHIYRSIEHTAATTLFKKLLKDPVASEPLKIVASIFIDLQAKRHEADYDPFFYVNRREVAPVIRDAETALNNIEQLVNSEKKLLAARLIGRTRR